MSIVHDDDLPAGMKIRQKLAHQIADQACDQVWNIAAQAHEKIGRQISGNEALSYMGTILQDFAGRWLTRMNRIREADDAGVLLEDMIKITMDGILSTIGCSASYEKEPALPDGIKKLKKECNNESE